MSLHRPRDSAASLHGMPDVKVKTPPAGPSSPPGASPSALSSQASGAGSILRSGSSGHRSDEDAKLPLGAQHYELLEEVGTGMTAKVYTAVCSDLGLEVAIKIVNLETSRANLDTVTREAMLMTSVQHRYILPLRAAFCEGTDLWLVMPFASGGSLQGIMQWAYPQGLDEKAVATIMKCVLQGLEHLHRHGIIHRDVKASNVVLDGRTGALQLADFGVGARLEYEDSQIGTLARLTRTTYVGSPAFMAPEVINPCGPCDGRQGGHNEKADIYSAGITCVELALGKTPFGGVPYQVMVAAKLHASADTLDLTAEDRVFSADMKELVGLCLRPDPAQRPSATALLRHRWFKRMATREPTKLVRQLVASAPPLLERLEAEHAGRAPWQAHGAEGNFAPSHYGAAPNRTGHRVADSARMTTEFGVVQAGQLLEQLLRPKMATYNHYSSRTDGLLASLAADNVYAARFNSILPRFVLRECRALMFCSRQRKGIGVQTSWGVAFIMAKYRSACTGKDTWVGPCYCYVRGGSTSLGIGADMEQCAMALMNDPTMDFVRSQIRNCPHAGIHTEAMYAIDVEGENLSHEDVAQRIDVAARHDTLLSFWFRTARREAGVHLSTPATHVHVDDDMNARVFGRRVDALDILAGKVPPPERFEELVVRLEHEAEPPPPPPAAEMPPRVPTSGFQGLSKKLGGKLFQKLRHARERGALSPAGSSETALHTLAADLRIGSEAQLGSNTEGRLGSGGLAFTRSAEGLPPGLFVENSKRSLGPMHRSVDTFALQRAELIEECCPWPDSHARHTID